jgi:reactive intermediate/imine deaminase
MNSRCAPPCCCSSPVAACRVVETEADQSTGDGGRGGEYLTPFGAPTRPFSPAVRVGDLIFLSGQIGTDASASGAVVAGGIEAETRQTMENIRTVLTAVGSGMDRVVKCTVMMADMKEWDRMNAVYATYFAPDRLPARSALRRHRSRARRPRRDRVHRDRLTRVPAARPDPPSGSSRNRRSCGGSRSRCR